MHVTCVYKIGGDFDGEYVEALHKTFPNLLCLTDADDVPDYINQQPLVHRWPNWWSKIELFNLPHPTLYLDLDVVVLGDISHVYGQCKGDLIISSGFYKPKEINSSVMYIPTGTGLYEKFVEKPDYWMNKYRGDQDFIFYEYNGEIKRWQEYDPNLIASYKAHIRKDRKDVLSVYPKQSKIIAFHGKPRPRDVKEIWNAGK